MIERIWRLDNHACFIGVWLAFLTPPTNQKQRFIRGIAMPLGKFMKLVSMIPLFLLFIEIIFVNFKCDNANIFRVMQTSFLSSSWFFLLKVVTLSVCVSLSSWVALVILFGPKMYILILKPEKNDRRFFTTSKEVRCHIGGSGGPERCTFTRNRMKWSNE